MLRVYAQVWKPVGLRYLRVTQKVANRQERVYARRRSAAFHQSLPLSRKS